MRVLNPTISITTFSGNGLNTPTEKQRLSDWIKKAHQYVAYTNSALNMIQMG